MFGRVKYACAIVIVAGSYVLSLSLSHKGFSATMNKSYLHASSSKLFPKIIYTLCPEWNLNLSQCRMAVFEDYEATTLTIQPPRLDELVSLTLTLQSLFFESIINLYFLSHRWL